MTMLLKERVRRGHGRRSVARPGAATRSHARRLPGREGARPPELGAQPPGPSVLASRAAAGSQGAVARAAGAHLCAAMRAAVKVTGPGCARVSRVAGERAPARDRARPRRGREARERAPVRSHGARPSASTDTGPGAELGSQGTTVGVGPSAFVSAGKGTELDSRGAAAAGVTGHGRRRSSTRRREAWARPSAWAKRVRQRGAGRGRRTRGE